MYAIGRARTLIEKVFGKQGLEIIDYRDIFHSTVARVIAIPEDKSRLADFVREAKDKVGKSLKSNPLQISATRAFHSVSLNEIVKKGGLISP